MCGVLDIYIYVCIRSGAVMMSVIKRKKEKKKKSPDKNKMGGAGGLQRCYI